MRKNVLIVDDEVLIAMFLQDIVEDMDFGVVGTAMSCAEATALAAGEKPDIALIDLNLKGAGDGTDIGRHLVETYGTALIFLSGEGNLAGREDVEQLKPVAVLQKPCQPETIEQALKSAESRLEA